ncbi:uncharacterized protein PRD47_016447 isoform 1-T1 [Ara ararauna]
MAVAVLRKHAVYASFCSRKKQWSGQNQTTISSINMQHRRGWRREFLTRCRTFRRDSWNTPVSGTHGTVAGSVNLPSLGAQSIKLGTWILVLLHLETGNMTADTTLLVPAC